MGRFAASFDPALVHASTAASVAADAAAIEKMASTVKAMAAARAADGGAWRGGGDRSAAHHLARATGTTVGQAAEALDTGRRLREQPHSATAEAARRGELSLQQAAAIASAAEADPSAEAGLVADAGRLSLAELRSAATRVRAAGADSEARRRAIQRQRYLRHYTDGDGVWQMRVQNTPEVGACVMAALNPIIDRLFGQARREGRHEPLEHYAADALTELCATATAAADTADHGGERGGVGGDGAPRWRGAATKIIVRVDLPAWLRGYPMAGEVCEIVGFGPVAVSAVRDMVASGDPFLAAVATRGTQVLGVAHLGRRPTAYQRTALEWLYPQCSVEGCPAQARLEIDHRLDWADTHFTVVDLLDRLCHAHHQQKTTQGWALIAGTGSRPFVPADDPRHPHHHPPRDNTS